MFQNIYQENIFGQLLFEDLSSLCKAYCCCTLHVEGTLCDCTLLWSNQRGIGLIASV